MHAERRQLCYHGLRAWPGRLSIESFRVFGRDNLHRSGSLLLRLESSEDNPDVAVIEWDGRCAYSADELLAPRRKERAPRPPRRDRRVLPEVVTFTIARPPGYDHLSLEEVRSHFRCLLDERVQQIHAELAAEGRTRFRGAAAVRTLDPFDGAGDTFPSFARNPLCAAAHKGFYAP